jgi:hypothetical protein
MPNLRHRRRFLAPRAPRERLLWPLVIALLIGGGLVAAELALTIHAHDHDPTFGTAQQR